MDGITDTIRMMIVVLHLAGEKFMLKVMIWKVRKFDIRNVVR